MLKKSIFLLIVLLFTGLMVVQAQTQAQQRELEQIAQRSMNGLSSQDRQRVIQIMTDVYVGQGMSRTQAAQFAEMAADTMFTTDIQEMTPEERRMFEAEERRIAEANRPQQQTQQQQQQQTQQQETNDSTLITPAGKAWVIRDNNVQGSGRALIMKRDNTYEFYRRVYGIWFSDYLGTRRDSNFNKYSTTGNMLEIRYANDTGGFYSDRNNYTISGNTLTITGRDSSSGTWTLMDFSESDKLGGGSVVLPAGMGWFSDERQMIFNTNGIYAAYGFSSTWARVLHEGTYRINPSTGRITINEYVPAQQGRDTEYFYSITDFPNGNKTLRIWGENRNGYQDDVYRLQAYPSGTQLPRQR